MGIFTNEPNKSIIREARGSLGAMIKADSSSEVRAGQETRSGITSFLVLLPVGLGMGCSTWSYPNYFIPIGIKYL